MKIALCFYGQMRTVELVNNFYSKYNDLEEDVKFDFFISTWNDFDKSTLTIPYKAINCENELSSDCIRLGKSRASNACYHINKVVRLKEDYETKNKFAYDAVVLLRTDWALKFSDLLKGCKNIVNSTENYPNNLVVGLAATPQVRDGNFYLTSDGVFIHNNIGANIHANLYNLIYLTGLLEKTNKLSNLNGAQGHIIHGYLISMFSFCVLHTPIQGKHIRVNGGKLILNNGKLLEESNIYKMFLYE